MVSKAASEPEAVALVIDRAPASIVARCSRRYVGIDTPVSHVGVAFSRSPTLELVVRTRGVDMVNAVTAAVTLEIGCAGIGVLVCTAIALLAGGNVRVNTVIVDRTFRRDIALGGADGALADVTAAIITTPDVLMRPVAEAVATRITIVGAVDPSFITGAADAVAARGTVLGAGQ